MDQAELEQTLVLIKPDALKNSLTGYVLSQLSEFHTGLRFAGAKIVHVHRMLAEEHYAEHRGKPFFEDLVSFMTSGPCVVAVLEADNAVQLARALVGATDPFQAAEGTLRRAFGSSTTRNAVHASDSPRSAEREVSFFFPEVSPGERGEG